MIRQRSEDRANFHVPCSNRGDKRHRFESDGLASHIRCPSPSSANSTSATVSRGNKLKSELLALIEAFCVSDQHEHSLPKLRGYDDLFDFVCPSSYGDLQQGSGHPHERPHAVKVLLELCAVCDQVWRHGTCAESLPYTHNRRTFPFDDSGYNPSDLLLPVPVAARVVSGVGRSGAGRSLFNTAKTVSACSSQQEDEMRPLSQEDQGSSRTLTEHVHSVATSTVAQGTGASNSVRIEGARGLRRLTMQPLTCHILLSHGGFERTSCFKFVHLRPATIKTSTCDVLVPAEIVEGDSFVRPLAMVASNQLNPVQPTSLAVMSGLFAACRQILVERGWPQPPMRACTPLTIFLGHADGFGWRDDLNTLDACQSLMIGHTEVGLRLQQDVCFLLWDAMLTDGGLPQIERALHRVTGTSNMYHAFTSHYSYGAGLSAICVQSVPATVRRPTYDEMDYCSGSHQYHAATSCLGGEASPCSPASSSFSAPFSFPLSSPMHLVSPPHLLCRARLAYGCAMVVMPVGLDGPVVFSFFVNRAIKGEPSSCGVNRGGDQARAEDDVSDHCSIIGRHHYGGLNTNNVGTSHSESLADRSIRYLWWYVHETALAPFPPSRVRVVCSVGELLTPEQVLMLPTQKRDLPRLEVITSLCCDGYVFVEGGGEGNPHAAKGCRFVSSGTTPCHIPPMQFVDL